MPAELAQSVIDRLDYLQRNGELDTLVPIA